MHTISISGVSAPPPILLQADRVRRRIAASDSVAALVAALAFGGSSRDDHNLLVGLIAERVGTAGEIAW